MCKQDLPIKRVKERSIKEAKQKVDQWRSLYKNGEIDANGKKIKYSLNKAAEKVGVPKILRGLSLSIKVVIFIQYLGKPKVQLISIMLETRGWGFCVSCLNSKNTQKENGTGSLKIFIDERSQMHEPQHQNNFVDMIVEGDTVKQIRDNEYLDYSYVLPHVQSTIEEHEGIHEKQMNITNTDYECQNGQLVLN